MRLIDADALKEEFKKMKSYHSLKLPYDVVIDNAPTVDFEKLGESLRCQIRAEYGSCDDCELSCPRNELIKLLGLAKSQGEWIPVSERLPNRNGVYNVTRKLKEGETIYFISDASYFDGQNTWHRDVCVNHGRPYLTDVIAWQPLPEHYKEEGEEE